VTLLVFVLMPVSVSGEKGYGTLLKSQVIPKRGKQPCKWPLTAILDVLLSGIKKQVNLLSPCLKNPSGLWRVRSRVFQDLYGSVEAFLLSPQMGSFMKFATVLPCAVAANPGTSLSVTVHT
jgi:hypothetical protein